MLPAMDALLKLLRENAALSTGDLAGMLELSEDEIREKIRQAQADGDIPRIFCSSVTRKTA